MPPEQMAALQQLRTMGGMGGMGGFPGMGGTGGMGGQASGAPAGGLDFSSVLGGAPASPGGSLSKARLPRCSAHAPVAPSDPATTYASSDTAAATRYGFL